jgi:hypothetical protein
MNYVRPLAPRTILSLVGRQFAQRGSVELLLEIQDVHLLGLFLQQQAVLLLPVGCVLLLLVEEHIMLLLLHGQLGLHAGLLDFGQLADLLVSQLAGRRGQHRSGVVLSTANIGPRTLHTCATTSSRHLANSLHTLTI